MPVVGDPGLKFGGKRGLGALGEGFGHETASELTQGAFGEKEAFCMERRRGSPGVFGIRAELDQFGPGILGGCLREDMVCIRDACFQRGQHGGVVEAIEECFEVGPLEKLFDLQDGGDRGIGIEE